MPNKGGIYLETTTRRLDARMLIAFRIIFTICLAATVIFIFSNSSEIGALSGSKSAIVTEFLNKALGGIGVGYRFSEHLVRKLAHFSEYMLLGFWLMLSLRAYTRRILSFISWPLFFGLLTATTDEFFQLSVSGRSGEVRDIVIDFSGVLAGIMAGLFAILLAGAVWDAFHGKR